MPSNQRWLSADEQFAALGALQGAGVVAVVAEEVVEVEVGHLVDFADHLGAEVVAQQVVDESAALLRFDPQRAEVVEVVRFGNHALDHFAPVFVHRNRRVAPIAATEDEAALRVDDDVWPPISATAGPSSPLAIAAGVATVTPAAATGARRLGDEVGAEQVGDAGVVVEPELVFLRLFVDAGAAPDHLVELDGRLQVAEEHHGVQALDVHAGLQQIHGAGDEGAFAGAAHGLDHVGAVVGAAHALEGVVVLGRLAVAPCTSARRGCSSAGHAVGVDFAGAEDDDLLLRPAVLAQQLEQVGAHRRACAVR